METFNKCTPNFVEFECLWRVSCMLSCSYDMFVVRFIVCCRGPSDVTVMKLGKEHEGGNASNYLYWLKYLQRNIFPLKSQTVKVIPSFVLFVIPVLLS